MGEDGLVGDLAKDFLHVAFAPPSCGNVGSAPADLSDKLPLDCLLACLHSGVLYSAYDVTLAVKVTPCKDPRTFFCPVCGSRLLVGAPTKVAVAECKSCSWVTDEVQFRALPDLLSRERSPYAPLEKAFDCVLKSLLTDVDHEPRVDPKVQRPSSGLTSLSSLLPVQRQAVPSSPPSEQAPDTMRSDCHCTGIVDCCSLAKSSETSRFHLTAQEVDATFCGSIRVEQCLPVQDKFSTGEWERKQMPPRRGASEVLFTVNSPHCTESAAEAVATHSITQAVVNASTFLPLMAVYKHSADESMLIISCSNSVNALLNISLEVLSNSCPPLTDATLRQIQTSWLDRNSANLPTKGASDNFVLRVQNLTTGQGDIIVNIKANFSSLHERQGEGPNVEPRLLNRQWVYRMFIAR